jgi:hypothetical protein
MYLLEVQTTCIKDYGAGKPLRLKNISSARHRSYEDLLKYTTNTGKFTQTAENP